MEGGYQFTASFYLNFERRRSKPLMRILKIHFFHNFEKAISQERLVVERWNLLQTGFFTLFYPHAKFGEDSRTWVDILQQKYKLSTDWPIMKCLMFK